MFKICTSPCERLSNLSYVQKCNVFVIKHFKMISIFLKQLLEETGPFADRDSLFWTYDNIGLGLHLCILVCILWFDSEGLRHLLISWQSTEWVNSISYMYVQALRTEVQVPSLTEQFRSVQHFGTYCGSSLSFGTSKN